MMVYNHVVNSCGPLLMLQLRVAFPGNPSVAVPELVVGVQSSVAVCVLDM